MDESKVWLLTAPATPYFVFPGLDEPVDLRSRSIDLLELVRHIVLSRRGVDVSPTGWRSTKKSLSKLLDRIDTIDEIKERLGFKKSELSWKIILRFSKGAVSLQPWIEVDYWLMAEMTDNLVLEYEPEEHKELSVTALKKLIEGSPQELLDDDLQKAVSLWGSSREVAFQFLDSKVLPTVGTFCKYMQNLQSGFIEQPGIPKEIGEFSADFFWNATELNKLVNREDKIIEAILDDKKIPSYYFYDNYAGTKLWLTLADVKTHAPQAAAVAEIERIAPQIAQNFSDVPSLDFISLGPGDGVVDTKIISSLLVEVEDICYRPIDISPLMLATAISHMKGQLFEVDISGVVADFTSKLVRINDSLEASSRGARKLVTISGNTFGNIVNEWNLINRINRVLSPGDFFLIDVGRLERVVGYKDSLRSSVAAQEFYCNPLWSIEAEYDTANLVPEIEDHQHGKSVKLYCKNVSHKRFSSRKVHLFEVKYYENSLFDEMARVLNAEIVQNATESGLRQFALFKKN